MARFKKIYIEISNICNLQCSFCPVVERDKSVMSLVNFEKILKQASPLSEEVCLHLMGEPLTHPHFLEILQLTTQHNVPVFLTTNGILIARHQELLLQSPNLRQINFSLHALKDNFPQKDVTPYLESIMNFAAMALEKRPELYINFRLWNLQEEKNHHPFNQEILRLINQTFHTDVSLNVDVAFKKSKKILQRLYLHFDSRFTWPSPHLPKLSESGFCHGLSSHVGIHADGTVVPCCLDKEAVIKLGNCLERPLEEIIDSPRAQSMREGFQKRKLVEDLCQRCPFIQRFQKSET